MALVVSCHCAPKRDFTTAPVPAWDIVEGMTLTAPEALSSGQRRDFEQGWQYLKQGNLEAASSRLEGLGRRYGQSPSIATANGFVELRLGNLQAAERHFQSALREQPAYGPAEAGNVLAALATGDEELAYERLTRLEEGYPQHPLVDRYKTTLQVNIAESRVGTARRLAREDRYEEAAAAYLDALEVAPEVGSLYLEAAEAEMDAGLTERAVHHAERATELEPDNASAFSLLGEARYEGGDVAGAYQAYRTAVQLSPRDPDLQSRMEAIQREYEVVNLPPEYNEILDAERLTREQLAALLYVELRSVFDALPPDDDPTSRDARIAIDIGGSWASTYISRMLEAKVLEVEPNHMFQPRGFVRRVELASALASALEQLSPDAYRAAREMSRFHEDFPDLAPQNRNYEAAALAVSLGLMTPREEGAFAPQEFVSGAEGASAVKALAAHTMP